MSANDQPIPDSTGNFTRNCAFSAHCGNGVHADSTSQFSVIDTPVALKEASMLKVLIVEDSRPLGELFRDFLTLSGYAVVGIARSVDEAVRLVDLHDPDLAVVDFTLDGQERGTQIRPRLSDNSRMGILYVSGSPLDDDLNRLHGEGFVQKPVGIDDLARALRVVRSIRTLGTVGSEPQPACLKVLPEPAEATRRTG